ncbi:MAG: hypothetical protein KAX65_10035 [Caldilineaceae bacterium]|nr:hypothetical protein [Caldilineaceae bacterium]
MRANVKPLTHWVIYKGYSVRFTARSPEAVAGWLTLPTGEQLAFRYDPAALVVALPERRITINDYGWEVSSEEIPACPAVTTAEEDLA